MAQSGYTPILIYASGTPTVVPTAGNLTSSTNGAELALNYADGKLYYKNNSGVVSLLASASASVTTGTSSQLLANNGTGGFSNVNIGSGLLFSGGTLSASGTSGVTSFQTSLSGLTPNTATSGAITLSGTLNPSNGGTGVTSATGTGSVVLSTTPTLTTPLQASYESWTGMSAPTYAEGRLWYDNTAHALAYYNDSSTAVVHIGQDLQVKVINNTGSTIANGSPVYITGTSSGQTYPNIALAKADVLATSSVIGLTNGAIANGAIGYVTSQGGIDNVNTSTFTVGQVLYLSPYSAGQLQNTVPPTGISVQVGVVSYVNSSTGKIFVKQTTPIPSLTGVVYANGTSAYTAATAAQIVAAISTTAVINATNSTNITNSGGWSVTPSGTKLYFNYNGTNVASLDSSGNLITLANITAYGTV